MKECVKEEVKEIMGKYHLNCGIEDFSKKIDWFDISCKQKLSGDFIEEFECHLNWVCISKYQKLSEDSIRKFKNRVSWGWISEKQKLSLDFVREFQDYVDWSNIRQCQHITKKDIRRKGKRQKKKVFCDRCKYCDNEYYEGCCWSPDNIEYISNYNGRKRHFIKSPKEINKNNDCKFYKNSGLYDIIRNILFALLIGFMMFFFVPLLLLVSSKILDKICDENNNNFEENRKIEQSISKEENIKIINNYDDINYKEFYEK